MAKLVGTRVHEKYKTSRINIVSLVADASAQLRHLSARVLPVCVMQNTAEIHRLQFSDSIDLSCPLHLQHNHCPTRLARMPHVVLLDGSSYTPRWRWLAIRQLHAVHHYPQVFGSSTTSVLSLYNIRSRLRCSYLVPTSFTVQILNWIFCERLA